MAQINALSKLPNLLALGLLLVIAGCGDFDSAYQADSDSWSNSDEIFTANVFGSVGDGPIVNARLRVLSNSGQLLMEARSTSTADYNLTVRTQGRNYPLTIVADQGTDLVTNAPPDFSLVTTVMKPGDGQTANLNPYSTLIVKAAQKAGGITDTNIEQATEAVVAHYGFGLDPSLLPDPIFTPMDESNVHLIVKASETMGEMIRRTRDALTTSGTYLDGDAVVEALSADLIDGWIDGKGAIGHDPRIAAVANVASAAVLVEAMANRLHVYGADATAAMDNAIRQVRPNAPASSNTRNVRIPREALDQGMRALRATESLKRDARITQAYDAFADADSGVVEIQALPSGIDNALKGAVLAAAYAEENRVGDVNNSARGETVVTPAPAPTPEPTPELGPEPIPEFTPNPTLRSLWARDGWLLFDGISDRGETGLDLKRLAGTSFTAEAVIQYTGSRSRTWTPIFGASYAPQYQQSESFFIGKNRDDDKLSVNIGGLPHLIIDSKGLFDGREHHLAVVFDQSARELRIFVDQALIHARTGVPGPATGNSQLLLGAVGHTTSERWIGWIGPARITGNALKPSEFLVAAKGTPRPNAAPAISGAPTTALVVGYPWNFTPNAFDPDGDTLTFSIQGRPAWATFDAKTGRIAGTPPTTGSSGPITISVSDGAESSSLSPFTLQVDKPTLGTANLSWNPPTRRTDGSALTDLAGYRVYYGKDPSQLSHTIVINNPGQTNQFIDNLDTGTWYFAVTAVCSKGLESPKSAIGSKKIM